MAAWSTTVAGSNCSKHASGGFLVQRKLCSAKGAAQGRTAKGVVYCQVQDQIIKITQRQVPQGHGHTAAGVALGLLCHYSCVSLQLRRRWGSDTGMDQSACNLHQGRSMGNTGARAMGHSRSIEMTAPQPLQTW